MLIETSNETAYRSLTEHGGPVGTGGTGKQGPKGQEGHTVNGARCRKRRREEEEVDRGRTSTS